MAISGRRARMECSQRGVVLMKRSAVNDSEVPEMLISKVELPVSDVVEAARFYGDVLGLPIRTGGGIVEVGVGLSVLLLDPGPVELGAYHCAITVPEDRFAESKAWLQERVPLLERDGLDEFTLGAPWNSQSVYFAGPDGILLELIARHNLPAASSGRFSSADLLRISEIRPCRAGCAGGGRGPAERVRAARVRHRCGRVHPARQSRRASDRRPAGPILVPHHNGHAVAGPYRCHRRAAKRRKVAGADRELPSHGGVTGSIGVTVSVPALTHPAPLKRLADGTKGR
jgi:catechol 2,3-dioxygenase-like lactoylglutathione lyase family enzyme